MSNTTAGKIIHVLKSKSKKTKITIAASMALVVGVAGYLLVSSYASGFFVSVDPENATVTGNASVVADASASGGKAIQFTGPASTGGGGTGGGGTGGGGTTPTCTGATNHVPGGADGTGTCWPSASNTGIPAGTALTNYTGSCVITTANTVIDSKTANCVLEIHAANVVIKNSKINGQVILDTDLAGSSAWSFTLQDSEVNAGTVQESAVGWGNMKVIRSNVYGGITAIQCEEKSVSCVIQDSYLHGQYIKPNSNWHLGGFLSDGGGPITLTHNTVACDQQAVYGDDGGCTGDINLIPNFGTAHNVTIDHNLLVANINSAYCTYAGDRHDGAYPFGNHIVYTNNIWQRGTNGKCANYGPVAGWGTGTGNTWTNNKYDNGATVDPTY